MLCYKIGNGRAKSCEKLLCYKIGDAARSAAEIYYKKYRAKRVEKKYSIWKYRAKGGKQSMSAIAAAARRRRFLLEVRHKKVNGNYRSVTALTFFGPVLNVFPFETPKVHFFNALRARDFPQKI